MGFSTSSHLLAYHIQQVIRHSSWRPYTGPASTSLLQLSKCSVHTALSREVPPHGTTAQHHTGLLLADLLSLCTAVAQHTPSEPQAFCSEASVVTHRVHPSVCQCALLAFTGCFPVGISFLMHHTLGGGSSMAQCCFKDIKVLASEDCRSAPLPLRECFWESALAL